MRPPVLRISNDELIVDNFAGGGGASTGIARALGRSPDIAVNHDPEALALHQANHPTTRHLCEDVFDVDPVKVCAGRPVGLAWFSPDCTFFSKARGKRPFRDKNKARRRRGLAGVVLRWAAAVRPRVIAMENVEEFQEWGPLGDDGLPDPKKRGFSFRRWWARFESMGYRGELREIRGSSHGAPTTRKRLFVIFRCDGLPIVWPEATHGPLQQSLPTITARDHHAVVTSNLVHLRGTCADGQPVDEPLTTITGGGNHHAEVRCFLMKYYGNEEHQEQQLSMPLHTITTKARFGLVTVTIAGQEYAVVYIGMRMLAPHELFRAQGFGPDYLTNTLVNGAPLTKEARIRLVGNSVCPPVAEALVRAQFQERASEAAG